MGNEEALAVAAARLDTSEWMRSDHHRRDTYETKLLA
jgi:hypothetical protein